MKAVFKSSDGIEHKTKEDALHHEAVVASALSFEKAARDFETAIGESCLTADGEYFDMRKFRSYWRVQRRYLEMPLVVEVSVYPHGLSIDVANEKVVVRWYEHDGRNGSYTTHPICDLYADKRKAELARLRIMEEDLAEFTEAVNEARLVISKGK